MTHPIFNDDALARGCSQNVAYGQAIPFPHASINNLVREDVCRALEANFPSPDAPLDWRNSSASDPITGKLAQKNKLGFSDELQLPELFVSTFWAFNSGKFLRFLEELTGIESLLPDPHYFGGGLHQYSEGAVLRTHADFNLHPETRLCRRLNVILFLNSNWQPGWNGQLELWDSDMNEVQSSIVPEAGTVAIFSTNRTSYHGVRGPLATPKDVTRKSLAFYYYTNGRDDGSMDDAHSTLWQTHPDEMI